MTRRRVSRDRNQQQIVDALRAVGAFVYDAAHIGGGFPDLIVGFRGMVYLMEIKNPKSWYGKLGMSESQKKFRDAWHDAPISLVENANDALFVIGAIE